MKKDKNLQIIMSYLKKDKFLIFLYLLVTVLRHSAPLVHTFLWATAFTGIIEGNYDQFFIYLCISCGIEILAWGLLQLPDSLIVNKIEKKFMENITKDLYAKINKLPAIAFEEIGTGEYINRLTTDTDRILDLMERLIRLTLRLIVAIAIVIISFTISIYAGLELLLLCVVMFIFSNIYYPRIKKTQKEIKEEADELVKVATQNISGIREIKALGIKDNINKRLFSNITRLFTNQRKIGRDEAFYHAINNISYFVIEFLILFTLGKQYFAGAITFTAFAIIEKYIWRIDDVVESLSEFGVNWNKVGVSVKRIAEILNNELYDDEKFGNTTLNDKTCTIKFNDVHFKYRDEEEPILKGLTMEIEPHKKIAVVGKSGQGKSTIFNLLLRYFDSTTGSITINDIDIKELTENSLRENISVIRQNPYLFNQTIMENFRVLKENITLDEVREACKKAYIDDYIMSLPNGYDTLIGEGGVNLSGGQKQRLAIARTLLKNTKIVLFDEATSALDNESQEYIKKTIDNLAKTHTIIIVAHRLSTIQDSDKIFIIDDGRVADSGTHDELMKSSSLYKKLYTPEVLDF